MCVGSKMFTTCTCHWKALSLITDIALFLSTPKMSKVLVETRNPIISYVTILRNFQRRKKTETDQYFYICLVKIFVPGNKGYFCKVLQIGVLIFFSDFCQIMYICTCNRLYTLLWNIFKLEIKIKIQIEENKQNGLKISNNQYLALLK